MDEGSGYCGSGSGIESVSDAALERYEIYLGQCRFKKETEIFGRQAGHYGFGDREGETGVGYFRGLLRETDKNEFSFRGIENKIVRRHPRRDESASGLKVVYGRRDIFRS